MVQHQLSTGLDARACCDHIIDQKNTLVSHCVRLMYPESGTHIFPSFDFSFFGLRDRIHLSTDNVLEPRNTEDLRETICEHRALVVAAMPLTRPVQRHGDD